MSELNADQIRRAVDLLHQWLTAPKASDGRTPVEVQAQLDRDRALVIDQQLHPLLTKYLAGGVPLDEFKSDVDSINKRHEYWGFKGIKGQMFFNMIVNTADDAAECDVELKAAIAKPESEEMARSRIKTFTSYVRRIGEQHVEGGGSKHGKPKLSSVPFFLSYFWQILDRQTWPVYYTNSVNMMVDLNLWQPGEDQAENYVRFKHIHEELAAAFSRDPQKRFGHWEVEHIFWFKGGNPFGGNKPVSREESAHPPNDPDESRITSETMAQLPDSYVPPVVAILPRMGQSDEILAAAARASGTTLERAFEKYVNIAFTILGFDALLLGQGQGRVPDGRAVDHDNAYAIVWDAKVRTNGYSLGTDDRTIQEYIKTQSRELKKTKSMRNIYYVIISGVFADDFDEAVRSLKMDTGVNEVILMEAESLVVMVEARLRDPRGTSLGPDGLQRLFSASGVLTADTVREMLVGA